MNAAGRWMALGLLGVAAVAGGGLLLQREEAAVLRREIGWLREEQQAMGRLRAENQQLKAAQAPAAEVERLRADRAALVRLRGEIDGMKARVEARANEGGRASVGGAPVSMTFAMGENGSIATEGRAVDFEALRERFGTLAAEKKTAELKLAWADRRAPIEQVKANVERITRLAKEAGLHFTLSLDQPQN